MKQKKQDLAQTIQLMNVVMVEEVRNNLKLSICNAVHELSQLLDSAFKACAESKLDIRVGIEELASYAAEMYLQSRDAEALFNLLVCMPGAPYFYLWRVKSETALYVLRGRFIDNQRDRATFLVIRHVYIQ